MVIDAEPEERRMSYLSDWCSSDTTAAEMHVCFCDFLNQSLWWIFFFSLLQMKIICLECLLQFDNLSLDQDMLSLRKECQEKDETIKDLTSFLQLTNKAGSKVILSFHKKTLSFDHFCVLITWTNMCIFSL